MLGSNFLLSHFKHWVTVELKLKISVLSGFFNAVMLAVLSSYLSVMFSQPAAASHRVHNGRELLSGLVKGELHVFAQSQRQIENLHRLQPETELPATSFTLIPEDAEVEHRFLTASRRRPERVFLMGGDQFIYGLYRRNCHLEYLRLPDIPQLIFGVFYNPHLFDLPASPAKWEIFHWLSRKIAKKSGSFEQCRERANELHPFRLALEQTVGVFLALAIAFSIAFVVLVGEFSWRLLYAFREVL